MKSAVLQGYATATDLADYLVKKGIPFRDSHEIVARAVRHAEEKSCGLEDLELSVLQSFNSLIEQDVYEILTPEGSLKARNHIGGTAPEQVLRQIMRWRKILG